MKQRVKNVLSYKKPVLALIIVTLITCTVTSACLLTSPDNGGENALSGTGTAQYATESLVYSNGSFSFVQTAENTPQYFIRDGQLMWNLKSSGSEQESSWSLLGEMEKITLGEDSFDRLFVNSEIWEDGFSAQTLRGENQNAWRVSAQGDSVSNLFVVLQQKNGDIYLAQGSSDEQATYLRWVYKLTEVT